MLFNHKSGDKTFALHSSLSLGCEFTNTLGGVSNLATVATEKHGCGRSLDKLLL